MTRLLIGILLAVLTLVPSVWAQDDVQRGNQGGDIRRATLKKLDIDKMVLTLSIGEDDHEFTLTQRTQVLGAGGKTLRERLRGFKEGAAIFFKTEKRDGKEIVVG